MKYLGSSNYAYQGTIFLEFSSKIKGGSGDRLSEQS
jgi:hypothetical protein